MTRDRAIAADWLTRFEGAGLDGVIAKLESSPYLPGKRAMIKVKHARTAECVVAGFRWHKSGKDAVGSLLLGLYDDQGVLQHVGVTSSFTMAMRKQLVKELEPLRKDAMDAHPWRDWAGAAGGESSRMPGAQSRWSAGKDLSWEPLRIERVCEVKYDHMQGDRFRHAGSSCAGGRTSSRAIAATTSSRSPGLTSSSASLACSWPAVTRSRHNALQEVERRSDLGRRMAARLRQHCIDRVPFSGPLLEQRLQRTARQMRAHGEIERAPIPQPPSKASASPTPSRALKLTGTTTTWCSVPRLNSQRVFGSSSRRA